MIGPTEAGIKVEEVPEVFLDFTDMSNRPTTVYAVRVSGKDNTNKPYARTRLFIRRASMEALLERIKEGAPEGIKIETYEGSVVWDAKIKPKKTRAKKKNDKLLDPPFEDAKLALSTREEGDQSRSAADCEALQTCAE
jgi:hypothetical protein